MAKPNAIAYFSMEICLDPAIPTYSGGLGVLAGDTLRSAADLKLPMVGVTLLHRKGYFRQRIDAEGNQTEAPEEWRPEDMLQELPERASVTRTMSTLYVADASSRPIRPFPPGTMSFRAIRYVTCSAKNASSCSSRPRRWRTARST